MEQCQGWCGFSTAFCPKVCCPVLSKSGCGGSDSFFCSTVAQFLDPKVLPGKCCELTGKGGDCGKCFQGATVSQVNQASSG